MSEQFIVGPWYELRFDEDNEMLVRRSVGDPIEGEHVQIIAMDGERIVVRGGRTVGKARKKRART